MKRQLRECELSKPVSEWLEGRGLEVYAEVPLGAGAIDLVGVDYQNNIVVSVEMKTGYTRKVFSQAQLAGTRSNEAWVCAPTKPAQKTLDYAELYGVGILRVYAGRVEIVTECPKRAHYPRIDSTIRQLKRLPKGGIGGKPCVKGEGPAQSVAQKVRDYIKANCPKTWQEVFENVPNHYAHARSMGGTMSMNHNVSLGMFKADA